MSCRAPLAISVITNFTHSAQDSNMPIIRRARLIFISNTVFTPTTQTDLRPKTTVSVIIMNGLCGFSGHSRHEMSCWMSGLELCLVTIWPRLTVASVCCNSDSLRLNQLNGAPRKALCFFVHSTASSLNSETQSVSGHRCLGVVAQWRCTS